MDSNEARHKHKTREEEEEEEEEEEKEEREGEGEQDLDILTTTNFQDVIIQSILSEENEMDESSNKNDHNKNDNKLSSSCIPSSSSHPPRIDTTLPAKTEAQEERKDKDHDQDSSPAGSPSNKIEISRQHSSFLFLRHLHEEHLFVFTEPPSVNVLKGIITDTWPTKTVEYDLEMKYKDFKWRIIVPRKSLYGLWFYVKGHGLAPRQRSVEMNVNNAAFPTPRSSDPTIATATATRTATTATATATTAPSRRRRTLSMTPRERIVHAPPQLRKLFLANAEKSISADMLALIQEYLQYVFSVPHFLSSSHVLSFLQVSASTFDEEGGYTSKREGWLQIRMWCRGAKENIQLSHGSVTCDNPCFNCLCVVKKVTLKSKRMRWVAVKKSCIVFYRSITDTEPSEVLLFDQGMSIERGVRHVGSSTSLIVKNNSFVFELVGHHKESIVKWANAIRQAVDESEWSANHRDESFSKVRTPLETTSRAKWLVDGQNSYEAIYQGLSSAKREVFIAGWWISPTIYLKRPAHEHLDSRLDVLLKKKAEEGVKIYILLYKEVSVALTLNSNYSKRYLKKIHPNIKVMRSPDFIVKQLGFWSHHEKIISIDQQCVFLGGLDLCLGRWDTHFHAVTDVEQPSVFPGKDYSNPRIQDFIQVHNPDIDLLDRQTLPRMPWHDVHCCLEGQPARDVARHFIQRWNYSLFSRAKHSKLSCLLPRHDVVQKSSGHPSTSTTSQSSLLAQSPKSKGRLLKAAKQISLLNKLKSGDEHSGSSRGFKKAPHIADRITRQNENENEQKELEEETENEKEEKSKPLTKLQGVAAEGVEKALFNGMIPCACQIVRSISQWSGGCPTEHSIQNAYIRLISEAQHFIYIENQFFVSGLEGDNRCSNRIANALVNRILRAADHGEKFRVMVCMPLLPSFQGKPEEKDSYSLRGVMHWQYRTICRGDKSIYEKLFQELDDPFEYIAFYGLRTFGYNALNDPVTEMIYIHSKAMIVDDRVTIIGSANINERSMTGSRDSEIAVVIEDTEFISSRFNGQKVNVGSFAHSFRMNLFQEHFGATKGSEAYEKLKDPVKEDNWFDWQDQAMLNSQVYEAVFGCLPSDHIQNFRQLGLETTVDQGKTLQSNNYLKRAVQRYRSSSHRSRRNQQGTSWTTSPADSPSSSSKDTNEASIAAAASASAAPTKTVEKRAAGFGKALTSFLHDQNDTVLSRGELNKIKGHIVYFPIHFLSEEDLNPKRYPPEIFQ